MSKINTLSLATAIVFEQLVYLKSRKNYFGRFKDLAIHSEVIDMDEETVDTDVEYTSFGCMVTVKHNFILKNCYAHKDLQLYGLTHIFWDVPRVAVIFRKYVRFRKIPIDRNFLSDEFCTLGRSLFKNKPTIHIFVEQSPSGFLLYESTLQVAKSYTISDAIPYIHEWLNKCYDVLPRTLHAYNRKMRIIQ